MRSYQQISPSFALYWRLLADGAACIPAGGTFRLELFLPEDYPMAAPKVGPPPLRN